MVLPILSALIGKCDHVNVGPLGRCIGGPRSKMACRVCKTLYGEEKAIPHSGYRTVT